MNKKLLWIFGIIILIIIVVVVMKATGAIGKPAITEVYTEPVTKRTIVETVSASGKIYPEVEVKVSPDISGEIVELNVKEGDSVRRGQLLARIYADIYTSERDRAAASVAQSQAQVANSSASLETIKVRIDQAKIQLERQQKLFDQKIISRAELEQAETTLRTANAELYAAQQGIKGGVATVQSARTGLTIANKNLGRTTLTAPMDGVVSLLAVKKGERVVGTAQMAGTEMLRIADMSRMEVRVDVGENDIPKVHLGDSAIIEVDAYNNRKFKGLVTQIASSSTNAQQAQLAGSATDVTNYKVYIRILPESYQDLMDPARPNHFPFRPGMSANVDIQTRRHVDVLAVPMNAVTTREAGSDNQVKAKTDDDAKTDAQKKEEKEKNSNSGESGVDEVVFIVLNDGTVKKVKVKTSIQDVGYIEITEGLKEKDQVVAGPYIAVSKNLKTGTKVKVVPKEKIFKSGGKN